MKTRSLLFANWKMNLPPEGIESYFSELAAISDSIDLAVAPPYPFLVSCREALSASRGRALLGGQNCSEKASGAFTGEVSASMLKLTGATYVILGHSERRQYFGETSELVGRKVRRALDDGILPVMCVGEDQGVRDAGRTAELLDEQLRQAFDEIGALPGDFVIAYEPVWAIGTGKTATPEMAADAHRLIREVVRSHDAACQVRILYGGSVTPENAAELAAQPEVQGFLVGGASLSSSKFGAIASAM